MSTVTVLGAHSQIFTLTYDTAANAALARQLAAAISAGVKDGTLLPAVDTDGPPPPSRLVRPASSCRLTMARRS